MSTLLEMSLTGGVIICVVILFRALFQNCVNRRTLLVLWAVAVLRLLVPVTIAAPTSVYNLPVFRQEAAAASGQEEAASAVEADGSRAVVTVPAVPTLPAQAEPERLFRWDMLLPLLWLAGAVGCMAYFLAGHLAARRRYRFSVPVPEIQGPPGVRIRMLDGLMSPLTYGIRKPVILLPPPLVRQGGPQLDYILRHELAHIRHHDVARKLILVLTASVHWFNPLVWIMVYLVSQDLEMYCDQTVIRGLSKDEKLTYAKILVTMEEAKLLGNLQTGFSLSSTGSRLKAIARAQSHPVLGRVLAVTMCVVLVTCFFTGQAPQADAAPESESETEPAAVLQQATPETAPTQTEPATQPVESATEPTLPTRANTAPMPPEKAPAEPTEQQETQPAAPDTPEPENTAGGGQAFTDTVIDLISPKYGANITFNTPGTMTMTVGENRTVSVSCEYPVDFFTDDPSIVHADSWGSGNSRKCSLNAVKSGTVNLYYQVWYGGEPHLYATITVQPNGDTEEVDFSDINGDTLDLDPPAPPAFPEPTEPGKEAIEIPGGEP